VTALETDDGSRRSAGVPYRRKAPRIAAIDLIFTEGQALDLGGLKPAPLVRKRRGSGLGRRQGCQRYGSAGSARNNTPLANPESPPKRIGRRETPGPPALWSRVQAHDQGRSASFEEMPGSDEARVLVVEAVGSRSRSVRIGVDLNGASQDKP